ncbi:hypothetical protein [Patulibacter defluvii]|uniref:hypothetical protein n=1 Tax=Patulibacter defluvii TaxID=3095358 RepID=UPI002A757A73|nr:hypothetical protein [Patulibacter sp. DM4]
MRTSPPLALLLVVAGLAAGGCGSDDAGGGDAGGRSAATTSASTTATTTPTATTSTQPPTTVTDPTATDPSGGTPPPSGEGTTTGSRPAPAGGVQPKITVDGDTARATADDGALSELWCDAARKGAYDDQLGAATKLVITVRGSDDSQVCELPR